MRRSYCLMFTNSLYQMHLNLLSVILDLTKQMISEKTQEFKHFYEECPTTQKDMSLLKSKVQARVYSSSNLSPKIVEFLNILQKLRLPITEQCLIQLAEPLSDASLI